MNILLCDDEPGAAAELSIMLRAYYAGSDITVHSFSDPIAALEYYKTNGNVDLAILDILMQPMNGTDLAVQMRNAGFAGALIFLTSSNDFASQSYAVDAASYLLKPLQKTQLCHALDKIARQAVLEASACLRLKLGGGVRVIRFAELVSVEVISHNLYFTLLSGEVVQVYAALKDYEQALLCDGRMARCHRSYIVNMDHVESLRNSDITMPGGMRITVTRKYAGFIQAYLKWIFKKTGGESTLPPSPRTGYSSCEQSIVTPARSGEHRS